MTSLFAMLLMGSASAQEVIDFDDVPAPCDLPSAFPLTTEYRDRGVEFEGPSSGAGGGVVRDCAFMYPWFNLFSFSPPQFLAFDETAIYSTTGNTPRGPEIIRFTDPIQFVEMWYATPDYGGTDFLLTAYDSNANIVDSQLYFAFGPFWDPAFISGPDIVEIHVEMLFGRYLALDELYFERYFADDDNDGFDVTVDCDDGDDSVYPGAVEIVADGIDQDCDGSEICYVDADGDGVGTTQVFPSADDDCIDNGESYAFDDCDDTNDAVFPGAVEQCNGLDDDCDGSLPPDEEDADNDGFAVCEGDCDDDEPTAYPGGPVIVGDSVDNDCDGFGECYVDDDDDGFGTDVIEATNACGPGSGYASTAGDCDDGDSGVNPNAQEVCSGFDDDCDGDVDDDDSNVVGQGTWYRDDDGDGEGNPSDSVVACAAPTDFVGNALDCNDNDDDVNTGAVELCNGIDDDCDSDVDDDDDDITGQTPWFADLDGDSFGDPDDSITSCDAPSGYIADGTDCDDDDSDRNPAVDEVCDGVENNCNGLIDDDDPGVVGTSDWYPDTDFDGFGDPNGTPIPACDRPLGTAASSTDCDDGDVNTFPGAPEQCDNRDNDCDEDIDEDVTLSDWWPDNDGDGFGDPNGTPVNDCAAPPDHVGNDLDCDDTEPTISPAFPEQACDGIDNDCDPATPDGVCDTGDTGPTDTGTPADTDTDTDTDTDADTDTDTDSDADTDTDTDTDTDADTDGDVPGGTNEKAEPPTAPEYGCGCVTTTPATPWSIGLAALLALGWRRRR